MVLDYGTATTALTITYLTPTTGTSSFGLTFSDIEMVEVDTGSGNDSINLSAASGGTSSFSSLSGNGSWIRSGEGHDTVVGSLSKDRLEGGDGNDILRGGAGDDSGLANFARGAATRLGLFGGAGNDQLFGEAGNDALFGGDGNDTLNGGSGVDQFVFTSLGDSLLAGFDVITDYALGEQLDAPNSITAVSLNGYSGTAADLNAAAIQTVLTSALFTPNSALAFRVTGQNGTFIALNNGLAGFNADTDSIIHLQNYSISTTNTVTLV